MSEDAKYLTSNPAFMEAIETARKSLIDQAMACDVKDDDGRRFYLGLAKTVDRIKTHIIGLASSDEQVNVADFYLEKQKSRFKALFS